MTTEPSFPSNGNLPVDKTIVEGESPSQPQSPQSPTALTPGTRAVISKGLTSAAKTASGVSYAAGAARLPEEGESVPMGSGATVAILGTGGMARVYKIWNEKLEVFRAVKIMLPTTDKKMLERFETEVKISAKLRHPNIVEIYSVGEWNGLPYIEMELIEGESLESIINRQGRLPEKTVGAIAIFVARALSYAHTQKLLLYGKTYHGLIHRDLKPANIMIAKTGEVKLMDFGIARPSETSLHTVAGNIVGTLPYLAPEQIDGDTGEMDNRVDIYACGTILYEMLTGVKTFPQNTITNLMKSKITNEYRRFDDFNFEVTPAMAKIAQKCLQVSKENRYANSKELLDALEAAFDKISDESPERVMQAFQSAPESIRTAPEALPRSKGPAFLRPVVLIPAGAALALATLIAVLLVTGPKPKRGAEAPVASAAPPSPPPPTPAATSPTPPVSMDQGLTPLGEPPTPPVKPMPAPAPAPTPAVRPGRSEPPPATPAAKPLARDPAKAPSSAPVSSESPLDQLKKAYGSDDAFAAGFAAFQKRRYADAITLLQSLPSGHAEAAKRDIMLMESLVETGRLADAIEMGGSSPVKDAQFELAAGKAFFKTRNYQEAVKRFENCLVRPVLIRNRAETIKDGLYYIGLVRSAQFRENPNADTRQPAWEAWRKVKEYINDPNDSRYKKANEELAAIK